MQKEEKVEYSVFSIRIPTELKMNLKKKQRGEGEVEIS